MCNAKHCDLHRHEGAVPQPPPPPDRPLQDGIASEAAYYDGVHMVLNRADLRATQLLDRQDGHLKTVATVNGDTHLYWKFTKGTHTGKYAYYRRQAYQTATAALCCLVGKLEDIDAGVAKPSVDSERSQLESKRRGEW